MTRQILFFAAGDDLVPVLAMVERLGALQYVPMGQSSTVERKIFLSGSLIPELGTATADSAIKSQSYLVAASATAIRPRKIVVPASGDAFCVDQVLNFETVTLTPGGVWREEQEMVLNGRVATVSDSAASQVLMKRFAAAMKKWFTRIRAFWVGPRALTLLDAGGRLTIGAQSSRDFDLTKSTI
jgi:hypothetical protein